MAIKVEDHSDPAASGDETETETETANDDTETPGKPEGRCVAKALIGVEAVLFEIYVEGADSNYFINGIHVDRAVYRDALETMDKDRWCPNCGGIHVPGHTEALGSDDDDSSKGEPS